MKDITQLIHLVTTNRIRNFNILVGELFDMVENFNAGAEIPHHLVLDPRRTAIVDDRIQAKSIRILIRVSYNICIFSTLYASKAITCNFFRTAV